MMNGTTGKVTATIQAAFMACVLAVAIFTAWHYLLRYAPKDPYTTPHQPYVSVSGGFGNSAVASFGHSMERYLFDFWRFGA